MLSLPWTTLARGPWSPERVVCDYRDQAVPMEPAVHQRVQALADDEHNPFFNGLGYRLDQFVLPSDDDKTLRLSLRPTDYFTMLSTDNALDEPITIANKKTTLREHYIWQMMTCEFAHPEASPHLRALRYRSSPAIISLFCLEEARPPPVRTPCSPRLERAVAVQKTR